MITGGNYQHHAAEAIEVYRSGAATTGADGVFAAITWDAESSALPNVGFTHSAQTDADRITADVAGRYCISASVTLRATGQCTGLAVRLTINGEAVAPVDRRDGLSLDVDDEVSAGFFAMRDLLVGDIVRLEVASLGVGSVPIVTEATRTFLQLAVI